MQQKSSVGRRNAAESTSRPKTMDTQVLRWEYYQHVSAQAAARAFVERLGLGGKRSKTVDAYARAIEDLLSYFLETDPERLLEADEADLYGYIAHLKRCSPRKRGRGGTVEDRSKILTLTGRRLADTTIAQRVVACRLFYEFLIRKRLRTDPINPIARGSAGRNGQRPVPGPVPKRTRLPCVPSDEVWKQFFAQVILHESALTRTIISLCYYTAPHLIDLIPLPATTLLT